MSLIYPNIVPDNNLRLPDALTIKHGPTRLLSTFVLEGDKAMPPIVPNSASSALPPSPPKPSCPVPATSLSCPRWLRSKIWFLWRSAMSRSPFGSIAIESGDSRSGTSVVTPLF